MKKIPILTYYNNKKRENHLANIDLLKNNILIKIKIFLLRFY